MDMVGPPKDEGPPVTAGLLSGVWPFLLGCDWLLVYADTRIIGRSFRIGHGRFVSGKRRFLSERGAF